MNDIEALIKAQCSDNLVKLYTAFVNKKSGRLFNWLGFDLFSVSVHVVLELMDLGSLADMKRSMVSKDPIPEDIIANITLQMVTGLTALHGAHQLHRDIKPQNILINTEGWVKLTDFGIAKELDNTAALAQTFVGTSTYMSPERATGQPYSYQADVWSIGLVVYELATGVSRS
jgi:serine/threonine protein kinase